MNNSPIQMINSSNTSFIAVLSQKLDSKSIQINQPTMAQFRPDIKDHSGCIDA